MRKNGVGSTGKRGKNGRARVTNTVEAGTDEAKGVQFADARLARIGAPKQNDFHLALVVYSGRIGAQINKGEAFARALRGFLFVANEGKIVL